MVMHDDVAAMRNGAAAVGLFCGEDGLVGGLLCCYV